MNTSAGASVAAPFEPGARPQAGIGLKAVHVGGLLRGEAGADFLEVHAENYLGDGGPFLKHLAQVRERWPLSIHGVGLSIGGEGPLDRRHLERLAALVRRFEPQWFSEHLAWSSHGGRCFNDLLPLPYDAATLNRVCDHVDEVQQHLKRRLLLENPSTYLEFESSTMDEGSFLAEVVKRTGCGLLLDVNNAFVSAVNHRRDPWALITALPPQAIGEIHLAGFAEDRDAAGDRLLIDSHGTSVDEAVWALYRRTIERLGPVPTLIERDNDLPTLALLAAEAARARQVQVQVQVQEPVQALARHVGLPEGGVMTHPTPPQHPFAQALLDPGRPVPAGLVAWNGADPSVRFGVHRNNVLVSLVGVLADTFPVVRRLVGAEFFDAMARLHVCAHPPASPVMNEYGAGFADWLADFEPVAALPYLADMARLERARVTAFHAGDAEPLQAGTLARCLADPALLPGLRLGLHPSLAVLAFKHAVVSLWAAHQCDDDEHAIGRVELHRAEWALVLRHHDEVLVLPASAADAALVGQLRRGLCLADAVAAAPGADLAGVLGRLLQHGALVCASMEERT